MQRPLTDEDPVGNVPLLLYRLFERIARPQMTPQEFGILAPHAQYLARKLFSQKGDPE